MCRAFFACRRDEKWLKNVEVKGSLEDLGLDGRTIMQ
jgi:hypothetical protein